MQNGRLCSVRGSALPGSVRRGQNLAAWARDDLRIAMAAARAAGQRYPDVDAGSSTWWRAREGERHGDGEGAHEGDELSRRLLDEAGQLLGRTGESGHHAEPVGLLLAAASCSARRA